MNKTRMIGYPFGAAVVASLIVLFLGMCVFGFHVASWTDWQGGIVGVAGTVAGVAGAIVGFRIASRTAGAGSK